MSQSPPFNIALAHHWFSCDCFNRVWGYLEKTDRTEDDNEAMLSLAHASVAHWRDREDCTNQNLSVGYWQLSRVYAVLRQPENARRYAQLCNDVSSDEPAFFLGYAFEAMARAEKLSGNDADFRTHLRKAREKAEEVDDSEDRKLLEADLADLVPA